MMKRLALLILALTAGGVFADPTPPLSFLPRIKTVFVIALENHDWTQVCPDCSPQQLYGNPAAPYLNSLVTPGNAHAAQVSYATAYYSVAQGEHPSEPNYVWSEAGTDFGIRTDNDPSTIWGNLFSTTNHLCGQLSSAGIPWHDYQEDVEYAPAANISSAGIRPDGPNIYNGGTEYYYAVKHNPMEFFADTQDQNVYPLAQLWTDLASNTVGRYNWIAPDEFNEMHSYLPNGFDYQGVQYTGNQAAIAEGDSCLATIIPMIMASPAYQDHGVIILWTDETESTDDTNTALPEIILSPMAKGNAYASSVIMSHSSDLKTMDEIFHLAFQNDAVAAANDLSDMFQAIPPEGLAGNGRTGAVFQGGKMHGAGDFQLRFSGPRGHSYQILASDDLAKPKSEWRAISGGIFGSTNAIFTDHGAHLHGKRFYIIKSP
ncbi:MAG: alkaline phosphatase family protein [Limisphaerales bacterium]